MYYVYAVETQVDAAEPERKRLFALADDGSRRELHVEDHWPHKGWMVLKFAGIDSIDDAEKLQLECNSLRHNDNFHPPILRLVRCALRFGVAKSFRRHEAGIDAFQYQVRPDERVRPHYPRSGFRNDWGSCPPCRVPQQAGQQ